MADKRKATNKRKIPKTPKRKHAAPSNGQRRLRVAIWLIGLTLFFVIATIGVRFISQNRAAAIAKNNVGNHAAHTESQSKGGLFSVRSISVKGNNHYTSDQILLASDMYVGQSVWNVDKTQATANIKAACPYVESVSISSGIFGSYTITVKETTIIGAMYNNGEWWLVGKNGQAVDSIPVTSPFPGRYLYFKGATPSGKGLGKQAMDDRSTEIVNKLLDAIEENELTGICEIDLANKGDIRLNWNNQITILLGNDSNLTYEISVVKEVLPTVLKNHGQQAHGTLDVSSYSDENATNRAIFSPNN